MDSIHYPYLVEHNKYQELLCTSLERKGFKVVKVKKSIFELLKYCIFSKIEILHLHWLHGITNSQGKVKTFFRIFNKLFCKYIRLFFVITFYGYISFICIFFFLD